MHHLSFFIFSIFSFIAFAESLKLSTGDLSKISGDSYTRGVLIVTFSSEIRPGKARVLLESTLSGCDGLLENFIPPSSFLMHSQSESCSRKIKSIPFVESLAPLPSTLRSPLLTATDPMNEKPVRIVRVEHIAGYFSQLEHSLQNFIIKDKVTITSLTSKSSIISALTLCEHSLSCDIDSPIDTCNGKCLLAEEFVQSLTSLDGVFWVERVHKQTSSNVHARAVTQTTDLVNWPGIALEYGSCEDSIVCEFKDDLPFSMLKTFYPTLGTATLGAGTAATTESNFKELGGKRDMNTRVKKGSKRATSILTESEKMKQTLLLSKKSSTKSAAPTQPTHTSTLSKFDDHKVKHDKMKNNRGQTKSLVSKECLQQTDCTATCSGPACGLGFSSCGGFDSPLKVLGLDGTGQIIQVVDSGLDFNSPFFFDPASNVTPSKLPPGSLTTHRKVVSYWSYMDALDDIGGHGTHVAGSVAGNAAPVSSTGDSLMLNTLSGMAPEAKIYFTDIGCQTDGGCTPPASIPTSCTLCKPDVGLFLPSSIAALFQPAFDVGSRISTNSWGGSIAPFYSSSTADIDSYVASHPDHLVIFAAGNDGKEAGYASLSTESVAKNVLTVGATRDGLLAHLMKIRGFEDVDGFINPLFGQGSPNSCGGILNAAVVYGVLSEPVCQTPLTNTYCAQLALKAESNPFIVPGDKTRGYLIENGAYFDLPFCCGCSAKQIFDGLFAQLSISEFSFYVNTFESTYNARWPSIFTSRGPTLDGRIKPDVAAPGVDIISARGSGNAPYNTFSCPSGLLSTNNSFDQTLTTFMGTGVPDEDPLGSILIRSPVFFTEPVYIDSINVYIDGVSENGRIYVGLVDVGLSFVSPIVTFNVQPGDSDFYPFQISSTFGAGFVGYIALMASQDFEFQTLITFTQTSVPQCFGSLDATLLVRLDYTRGGPEAWTMPMSGTSMATPVTAGNAALVRSYFTDGYHPTGARNGTNGFSPSSALMKAVLINSGTPTIDLDLASLFNVSAPPRNELYSEAGFGIASLARGLSFKTLGSATRASGALPTLLLPGLSSTGVDPIITDDGAAIYCIDTVTPSSIIKGSLPFSVTLVWTDPAASPLATSALVNDLDLEVTVAGSTKILYGNIDPLAPVQKADKLNNVEKVSLSSPPYTLSADGKQRLSTPFRVIVRGSAVIFGPQKYSLVVTGAGVSLSDSSSCGGDPLVPAGKSAPFAINTSDFIVVVSVLSIALLFFVCWDAFKRFRARPVDYSGVATQQQQSTAHLMSPKEQIYGVSASNLELGSVMPKISDWAAPNKTRETPSLL